MPERTLDISKIRHIVFDLGGVLLNIDYRLTEDAFRNHGLADFDALFSQSRQEGFFDEFEKGLISRKQFKEKLSRLSGYKMSETDVENAWNAMLLDFPEERLKMLEKLKRSYDLFLLSNTNEIHFGTFNQIFESTFKRSFSEFFTKDYYSHLIGKRKPDAEVFELIVDEWNLKPENILFIDDSEQHVIGAAKLGIQVIFLKKGLEIGEILRKSEILT